MPARTRIVVQLSDDVAAAVKERARRNRCSVSFQIEMELKLRRNMIG